MKLHEKILEIKKSAPRLPPPRTNRIPLLLHAHLSPGDAVVANIVLHSLHRMHPGRFDTEVIGIYSKDIYKNCPFIKRVDKSKNKIIKFDHPLINKAHIGISFPTAVCHYVRDEIRKLVDEPTFELEPCFNRPTFYLDPQEQWTRPMPEPYIIIVNGYKEDAETKWYSNFQGVVEILESKYPHIKILQVGESYHNQPTLKGKNVINWVGKFNGNGRALITQTFHSLMTLSTITFLMHVGAGFDKPGVVVASAYEDRTWACNYACQTYIGRQGTLPCCRVGGCWKRKFRDCVAMVNDNTPKCMNIPPSQVFDAIDNYLRA